MLYFQTIEAKNLLGNYDTSLFLKAQVDNLQGRNEELRNELKQTRLETSKAKLETQKAIEKVAIFFGLFFFNFYAQSSFNIA